MLYDATVLGAGPAGMIAMLRLASAGFSVLGVEKTTLSGHSPAPVDLRSTAFLMPAIETLKNAGIWRELEPHAVALDIMEIIDAAGNSLKSVKFDGFDIGQAHFGFNMMNAKLREILQGAIHNHPNITMCYGNELTKFQQFSEQVDISFSDFGIVSTRLLIGAEGRNSPLREKLGIATTRHVYDQWAQAFTVSHEQPHAHISTEIHEDGGPFTIVPSADINGRPASAIVWMDRLERVKSYQELDHGTFETAVNRRSHNVLGRLKLESEVGRFEVMSLRAERFHDHRCVLIGESAHVVPPIGAQGLNMSLKDIETLTRACETGALANPEQLSTWAFMRKTDIAIRMSGISALNSVSMASFNRAKTIRHYGLWALEKDTMLKRGLMRLGLGG